MLKVNPNPPPPPHQLYDEMKAKQQAVGCCKLEFIVLSSIDFHL